jgi:hypothetical protein
LIWFFTADFILFFPEKEKSPIYELSGWISVIKLGEGLGASLETINIYKRKLLL